MQLITVCVHLNFGHKKTAWQGGFFNSNLRVQS